MSVCLKSRLSFLLCLHLLIPVGSTLAQQKINDFTKRVVTIDGKISTMNNRPSIFNRMNPSTAKRIRIEDWPAHFSPFGGKRFPMGEKKILEAKRIKSPKLEIITPLNAKMADANNNRSMKEKFAGKSSAIDAVEYRNAYYKQTNLRVEDWMSKVNNLSLEEINRFQFRKGRSSKPGFPVQRAGAGLGAKDAIGNVSIRKTGLSEAHELLDSDRSGQYWLGPKRVQTTVPDSGTSSKRVSSVQTSDDDSRDSRRKALEMPRPVLGRKTIRVEVGKSQP